MLVVYRHFGTAYRPHLHGQGVQVPTYAVAILLSKKDFWPEMLQVTSLLDDTSAIWFVHTVLKLNDLSTQY
jgi:hypothetical protein